MKEKKINNNQKKSSKNVDSVKSDNKDGNKVLKGDLFDWKVGEKEEIILDKNIFGLKSNVNLIYQVMISYLSNKRQGGASTKNRSLVKGGGAKPWKQKGTGRARQGTIRSPLFKGGGVVFGPTKEKNYFKKINKKAKITALKMLMSAKYQDSEICFVKSFKECNEKTKETVNALRKINIYKEENNSILIIAENINKKLMRSVSNLKGVTVVTAQDVNVLDMINMRNVLIEKKSLEVFNERLKNFEN